MTDPIMTALETELRELGHDLLMPPAPDVRAAVRARLLDAQRAPSGWRPSLLRRADWRRRRVTVAAAALLATLALFAASPAGQAAVTHLLRLVGIEFRQGPAPVPRGSGLLPGETEVGLETARQLVAFRIVVPLTLGRPDRVTVSDGGRVVSLIYAAGPRRPAGNVSGVALRLDEFDGTLDPIFEKFLDEDQVHPVSVNGRRGVWVAGPHDVIYVGRDGQIRDESARLAGNTLIWQLGNVSLRLEGALSREAALEIALTTR